MDTWIVLGNEELDGVRRRSLYVLKSRGMAHANQPREFELTNHGLHIHAPHQRPRVENEQRRLDLHDAEGRHAAV
jgi:circadian clock protein KaiC